MLLGPSGSGKSDLALRFLKQTPGSLAPALVSDDQTCLKARAGRLIASAPATIAGKIEVRGIGILELAYRAEAELTLIVRLASSDEVPRLPPAPLPVESHCGIHVPVIQLAPFEASAHIKLRLALQKLVM